ncbi:sortase [Butyrivibrio sp. CB08]|uniref:class B sortase n=1 Tax=Butyrivibrio sp. CB08 TaxID=2364879 RepID=UPI000EAA42D1|nr:class B sortase [Butyrivibrio sp. CB08]RKM61359.1 sortase [Butyrivibrio sp. CB08]
MQSLCRNNYIEKIALKRLLAIILASLMLTGCAAKGNDDPAKGNGSEISDEPRVDFEKLKSQNSDIFAWINVPGTAIDYPVCQSGDGDDSFYQTHNYLGQSDPKGAIYTECANLTNMCDFNEVLHGSSPSDGTMFADLQKFLDKKYFDEHEYIYVYLEGNALVYYVYAAYTRNYTRLLETYDFTYAAGCQAFLDEVDHGKSMNKMLRNGWAGMVEPDNFIITLTTQNMDDPSKQIVVVGCLVGDVMGTIDREVDYSDPSLDW